MTGSGRAVFYHLTRSGLEETLLMILSRARQTGWRVMVRGTNVAALNALDARLWVASGEDGFLPHGLEGGAFDGAQPILIGIGALDADRQGIVLIDGAETSALEAKELQRVWVLFDGGDEAQLTNARTLWTKLTGDGMAAQYWSEESGRWVMKVEKLATSKV